MINLPIYFLIPMELWLCELASFSSTHLEAYTKSAEILGKEEKLLQLHQLFYRVSKKKRPAFERVLLPKYISNDILQYLIEQLTCSIIFRNFPG